MTLCNECDHRPQCYGKLCRECYEKQAARAPGRSGGRRRSSDERQEVEREPNPWQENAIRIMEDSRA